MSPEAMAIFIKPSSSLIHHRRFNGFYCKSWFPSLSFCTMKDYETVTRKSARLIKKTIAAVSKESMLTKESRFVNGGASYHQTQPACGLHILLNRLSKWIVAITFGGFIILRHDALSLWAATGSITNFILSITLKQIFKQKRPVNEVMSSGPGMPSSHAQTVFFALVFMVMSVIKWMGLNGATAILGIFLVALGLYFSWLRVLLGYHTTSQVIVGTIVGSNFAVLWFWAWEAVVCDAYYLNFWVQMLLFVGGACYYLGFIAYVIWHLIKD